MPKVTGSNPNLDTFHSVQKIVSTLTSTYKKYSISGEIVILNRSSNFLCIVREFIWGWGPTKKVFLDFRSVYTNGFSFHIKKSIIIFIHYINNVFRKFSILDEDDGS